ncbi:glycine--tRNA ligase subunit beta [Halobacillus sp. Marseille-Q1614]|uniref:glycine--tRNA ligase subunit beta n=1 Tax=Halobacillus sp. Marseille-Q1614 TaxID=2709134 RepID=UPI00156D6CCF|nr:glycine--tRNA ligase subunit beta [Halobacillus sp. Marseille-Q1614]
MSNNVLFELGLEEMPARFIDESLKQLEENTKKWLDVQRIPYQSVKGLATPRRLAVEITGVEDKQPDIEEEAKGPAKKIAVDDNGNWSKAAIGFSKGQGQNVEDIFFKDIKGVEYAHIKKFVEGQPTKELLKDFKEVLLGLNFPKNMRWADLNLRYVRPIRWMAALFESEVIPFEIEGVKTDNTTYGHRFLGEKTTIEHASQYEETLNRQYVIADVQKRKAAIAAQINELEKEKDWNIIQDPELLNEVTHLVEYPTVFSGAYSEEFLNVPEEALVMSMKEHQRYFPVQSVNGNLLPNFVAVRNGDDRHLDVVAKGNEKVLKARLSDAQFFYQEDQKGSLEEKLAKLKRMVYQVELGTLADKVERVKTITQYISEQLSLSEKQQKQAVRAAEICKFDLVTHMVDEFSDLQGIMGEKYARLFGEDEEVAVAVSEHYMPRHANGQLPQTPIGAVVSVADKLDTIIGSIAIGNLPTGSQDPYGLRRQSLGILQILKQFEWSISVEELLNAVIDRYYEWELPTAEKQELTESVHDFFRIRAAYLLKDENIAPDIVEAVLAKGIHVYRVTLEKAELLMDKRNEESFKPVHEALGRVLNLAKKADSTHVDKDLFENTTEQKLYDTFQEVQPVYNQLLAQEEPAQALEELAKLAQPIHSFFDQTMVMAENEKVKLNRLALLNTLSNEILEFADLTSIQWKQQF